MLITAAQKLGLGVGVVAPQGLGFLDTEAIEDQTGYPIRSAWRSTGAPARCRQPTRSPSCQPRSTLSPRAYACPW